MNNAEVLEKQLQGDIARLRELLGVAREHDTPFVNVLAQELEKKEARLTRLVDLRNRGCNEQEFNVFLTPTEREAFEAIERIFSPERIRLNLVLASLYLTAFEVLRNSIVEHIKDFFVIYPGTGDNAERIRGRMLNQYEQEVGVNFSSPDNYKLIPSCRWLQKNGVLSQEEIDEIKEIRDHRNSLAHNLPELILSEDALIVNLERFKHIREILRKVELFWIRVDMDIKGIDEDVSDENISGGESILDVIISTVFDYLSTVQRNEPT